MEFPEGAPRRAPEDFLVPKRLLNLFHLKAS